MKKMRELKIRKFVHGDFRKSEESNFNELIESGGEPPLKKGEGIVFISKNNKQLVFVEPAEEFDFSPREGKTKKVKVLASQRFRISGAKWTPEMLAEYADMANIKIVGIKRFDWYFKEYISQIDSAA